MRIMVGLMAAASVGFLSSALAMEPPASAPQTTSETSTPAAAEATTSSSKTDNPATAQKSESSNVKVTAGDDEAAAQLKRFRAAGYKPEVHDGSVVFCRNETELGSRFEKKKCTTAHLLEQQMAQAQDTLSTAQRNGTLSPRSN